MRRSFAKFGRDIFVLSLFAVAFLVMFAYLAHPVSAQGGGWLSGWAHRMKFTTNENVVDNTLENFPVAVFLDNTNFTWSHALSTGYDIRFTGNDGTTLLNYERERHDSGNGYAEYWATVPSVSGTDNTIIYMYYGKGDATDGANPTAVWDANFKGVWHLGEISGTLYDSTGNNNDGANSGFTQGVEVKIDGGIQRQANTNYVNVPSNAGLQITGPITLEAWVLSPSTISDEWSLLSKGYTKEFDTTFMTSSFSLYRGASSKSISYSMPANTMLHITIVDDGTNIILYINGSPIGSNTSLTGIAGTNAINIGNYVYNQNYCKFQKIDEARISNIGRSAAWIKASYNSGNNTLLTVGGEESVCTEVIISNIMADNILIDRDVDFSPGVITGTRLQADVEFTSGKTVVKENVKFVIYDALNAKIDNKQATENLRLTDNKQRFYVTYSALDNTLVNNRLGGWDVAVEARDNVGKEGTSIAYYVFYTDDLVTTPIVENLNLHRIRTYGTITRVSGIALTGLENVTVIDNNMGAFYASLSGNNWENIRNPIVAGQFYTQFAAGVLDGKMDNKSYAFPNIAPQIVSIAVSENLVDRKQDYAGSGAVLTTTLTLRIKDNDGIADMNAARIGVRDNLDAVQDNQDVWATRVVVDENTYDVTIPSYNPADSLANNKLGAWDVWRYVSDNWVSAAGWENIKFYVDDRKSTISFNPAGPYIGWSLTVSGTNSCYSITKSVTGSWLIDNVYGQINMGAFNTYSQTYTITAGLEDNVSVVIRTFDGALDGVSNSSYIVNENVKFEVYVRFEENYALVDWVPDENRPLVVVFQWVGGTHIVTLDNNPENIIVPASGIATEIAKITDNDAYWRYVIPQYAGGQLTFVIVGDYSVINQFRFFLQDYTTRYIPPGGQLLIKLWVGTNLAEINSDFWGADWRTTAWLIYGMQYQIWVKGVNAPLRLVGPIDAVAPTEEKTIVVQTIISPLVSVYDEVSWAAWRVDNNTIRIEYQDNLAETVEAYVKIYYENGTLAVGYQPDNEWFVITWLGADENKTYSVTIEISHTTYGDFTANMVVGLAYGPTEIPSDTIFPDMPFSFMALACVIVAMCVGMLFDAPRAHLAGIAIALVVAMFWWMGWLPLPGGWYTAVLLLFMAVMFALVWSRRR